jgi:hypothetical protein
VSVVYEAGEVAEGANERGGELWGATKPSERRIPGLGAPPARGQKKTRQSYEGKEKKKEAKEERHTTKIAKLFITVLQIGIFEDNVLNSVRG